MREASTLESRTLSCETNNSYSAAISKELFVIKLVSVICKIDYEKLILRKIEEKKKIMVSKERTFFIALRNFYEVCNIYCY